MLFCFSGLSLKNYKEQFVEIFHVSAILENLAIKVLYWPSMYTVVTEMHFGK